MAKFFIDRPVFAVVLSLLITIGGTLAGFALPIAQYPQISPPRIAVSTFYQGASAEVVEQAVAQIVEQQVNGVEGMSYMSSVSGDDGSYKLDVIFGIEQSADLAAVQAQNRVSQAVSGLPQEVVQVGVTTQKQSPDVVMYFVLYSPKGTFDSIFLKNYASVQIIEGLKRIKGVGAVDEYGSDYAMRIWLQADKMAVLNVAATDVQQAVRKQNIQAPAGRIGEFPTVAGQEFQYTAKAQGRLQLPAEFQNIIVRTNPDGSMVRIKDVARVELSAKNYTFFSEYNGQEAVSFAVKLTPDANALETVKNARAVINDAASRFPSDIKHNVVIDNTLFVRESLKEVVKTFIEALALVLVIVYIFLQSFRATLIPMLAVPVSLIGTFITFYLLGFSINSLTLFAMVLAIGLVVDDAIVVVEAAETHMRHGGLSPKEATYKAMEEVSGPVVAIAFVLASVFVPVTFFGGTVGVLYRQFAITIAVSMALSALIALSLTPALCALLLKPHTASGGSKTDRFFAWFNAAFDRLTEKYGRGVIGSTGNLRRGLLLFLVLLAATSVLFKSLPSGFVPDEDQGYFIASLSLPEAASVNRTREVGHRIAEIIRQIPGVKETILISGIDILSGAAKPNTALVVVSLHPWEERKDPALHAQNIIHETIKRSFAVAESNLIAFNAPALPGVGGQGKLSLMLQNRGGGSLDEMSDVAARFIEAANKLPEIGMFYSTFRMDTPGYRFDLDRERAETLGVSVSDVFQTLQYFMGGSQVNDFSAYGRSYKVIVQADAQYRAEPGSIRYLFVRNQRGDMVPLNAIIKPVSVSGPASIKRFNGYPAIQIGGDPAPGYSTGQALDALERVAKETLPQSYAYEWADLSKEEKESGGQNLLIFGFAIVFVFLCLAALYESWSVPFSVILSVPAAAFGAAVFQLVRQFQNDIYMQIGLVMLIGLAAKNAILIVEFAKERSDRGMPAEQAVLEAAKLRLRPILMTSLAFLIGCLPLMMASGPGGGARSSMGTAVVGGTLFATLIGLFLVPLLYVCVEKLRQRITGKL